MPPPRPCNRRSGMVLLVLVGLGGALQAAGGESLSPGEARRLAAGEVLVELRATVRGASREGIARGVIEAAPERVFRALSDWAHFEEWMPFMERSAAVPQPDGSVVSLQLLELPRPLGDRAFKIRGHSGVTGRGTGRVWRTSWSYVPGSGNIADHYGSWELVAQGPGRTLATCRLYMDPGGSVPRWAADRATEKSLPWIFDGLRQQVRRSRYD